MSKTLPEQAADARQLYEVRQGRVYWKKALDHKPGVLDSLSSRSAAYAIWRKERNRFFQFAEQEPEKLEQRLERMHVAEPGVAWHVSSLLEKDGIIQQG